MIQLRRYFSLRQFSEGFSLVELMVTITLMTVVGASIFTMMQYLERSRVRIETSAELLDDIDQAELFIRSKFRSSDRMVFNRDFVNPLPEFYSAECLMLLRREAKDRSGVNFVNTSGHVEIENYRGPGMGSDFTVGLWFKRDNATHTTRETMARWGFMTLSDNSSISLDLLETGQIAFRFGQSGGYVHHPAGLNDNRWHHMTVTFDNVTSAGNISAASFKIYVDGFPYEVSLSDPIIPLLIDNATSSDEFTLAKPHIGDNASAFGGVLSDLQVYSSYATADKVTTIYTDGGVPLQMEKDIHFRLDSVMIDNLTDVAGDNYTGVLVNHNLTNKIVTTTSERYIGDVFAMVDLPNDGNDTYALMHRADHNDCPPNENQIGGFKQVTQDIFVRPPADVFFDRSASNANDIIVNYGFSSGTGSTSVTYQAQPRKLALNKKFFDEDFCRADPNLVLSAPPGVTNCPIQEGFAYIATDYDNLSDELFIPGAQYWADNQTYYNIPGAPDGMLATWSSDTGVMTFRLDNGSAVQIKEWEKTMRQLAYRPLLEDYTPTKELVISLGQLPMLVDGEYHFYDFVEVNQGVTVDWEASQTAANNTMFCGYAGYLATPTSAEENAFLIERFRKSTGAVPAGWIGGSDVATPGTWVWETNSPEAGVQFWDQTNMNSGDASGQPRAADGSAVTTADFVLTDWVSIPGDAPGLTRRTTTSTATNVALHYQNWSTKEPNNANGSPSLNYEPYLQIVGSTGGNGYWNDLPDNLPCQDNQYYAPCGYYVEWGGHPGLSLNSLVYKRVVDLSVQREFCAQN